MFICILIIGNILAAVKIVVPNKNDTKIDYRMEIEVFEYQNSGSFLLCYNFLSSSCLIEPHCSHCAIFVLFHVQITQSCSLFFWRQTDGYNMV